MFGFDRQLLRPFGPVVSLVEDLDHVGRVAEPPDGDSSVPVHASIEGHVVRGEAGRVVSAAGPTELAVDMSSGGCDN